MVSTTCVVPPEGGDGSRTEESTHRGPSRPSLPVPGDASMKEPSSPASIGAAPDRHPVPDTPLRRSLRASILEGGVSETWNAFATGAVLTAWALFLGADAGTIAVLQGLATGAQVLHGPAAFLTEWVGRKRLAVAALTTARLV